MQDPTALIPVYSSVSNRWLFDAPAATLLADARYSLSLTRRGNVRAARLKQSTTPSSMGLLERSRTGQSFEQCLPSGKVWALQGVRGS